MDSREIIGSYVKVFKIYGLWPSEKSSFSYSLWSIVVSIFLYLLHTLFKLSSVVFANSIDEMVGILLVSSAVATISAKAFILKLRNGTFLELLNLIQYMDGKIHVNDQQKFLAPLINQSQFVFKSFIYYTCLCWTFLVIQVIISPPEKRIYSSTYFYPYESLKQPIIYVGGLIYEAMGNFLIIPIFVALNYYGVMLLCILVAYIDIFCGRLRSFGNKNLKISEQLRCLVEICEIYIGISR